MSSYEAQQAWIDGNRPDYMSPGEASVWLAQLDLPEDEVESLATLLSADERTRAKRLHFESDRHRFVVGRAILRLLLGALLRIMPTDLRFHYSSSGKPSLDPSQNPDDLRFNTAHADGLALFGVIRGQEIGIDLEYQAYTNSYLEVAEHFFSSAEKRMILALPATERLKAFYTFWTRKEAYLKGIGSGLGVPLGAFAVPLRNAEPVRVLVTAETGESERADEDERLVASDWLMYEVAAPPPYVAALATLGKISHLHQWTIERVKPTPRR